MPGVTIGSNAVIGGESVVVKDIPDDSVAVGNPCRVIRKITEADKQKCWDKWILLYRTKQKSKVTGVKLIPLNKQSKKVYDRRKCKKPIMDRRALWI